MRADATAAALDCTQAIVSGRVGIGEASTFSKSTLALEAMAGFSFWAIATAQSANRMRSDVGQAASLRQTVNRRRWGDAKTARGRLTIGRRLVACSPR